MSFSAAFLALMPHTATVTAFANYSTAGYGTPTYAATATTMVGRLVAKQVRVRVQWRASPHISQPAGAP